MRLGTRAATATREVRAASAAVKVAARIEADPAETAVAPADPPVDAGQEVAAAKSFLVKVFFFPRPVSGLSSWRRASFLSHFETSTPTY